MTRPTTITDAQIREAARAVFLERGINATAVDVANRAGISSASIFKRYATKEALFTTAMREAPFERMWTPELETRVGHGDPTIPALTLLHTAVGFVTSQAMRPLSESVINATGFLEDFVTVLWRGLEPVYFFNKSNSSVIYTKETRMNIAILAFGSQGDVQPYIALGVGLQRAGHHIRIVTHENYETHVQTHNLEFRPVQGNVQAVMDSPELRALIEKGNFLAINAYTSKLVKDISLQWLQAGLEVCRNVELIVTGVGGLFTGLAIAEKLDLPIVQAPVFPFTPTADFPGVLLPQSLGKLGGLFNRLSHGLVRQIMWQGTRAADNAARKHLGLPTAPFFGPYGNEHLNRYPTLYGFSPSVIPTPRDWTNANATGYWFLDAAPDWQPPTDLEQFLQRGPPPVYIGFGSMGSRNPEETAALVLQAIANTKQRAILQAGWGGLKQDQVPEHVHMIGQTPHGWLFPKMATVVHHGGAGTTAAGLRAGVPSIIVPFFGDQPFWGERVAQLGVGTKPIPRKQLNADNLAQAIQTATGDSSMRKAAAQLGAKIRAEDGIAAFVKALETIKG